MSARPLTPAERAMRIAWKVQLSEDTRQRKLAMRADAKDRVAKAEAKRLARAAKRIAGNFFVSAERWLMSNHP